MMIRGEPPSENEETVRRCYRSWSTWYFDAYYGSNAPYPPVHVDIIRDELLRGQVRYLLDAGCGPASMLRLLAETGRELYGFDLTPEMVAEARRALAPMGVSEACLWVGSVTDNAAFRPPSEQPGGYDAVVCAGVLPHVPAELDAQVLANLRGAVRPGGLVLVEARNQLFAMFTLNRFTRALFREVLVDETRLRAAGRDDAERGGVTRALELLDKQFRLDLPPIRPSPNRSDPSYDEILSRTHNPFKLKRLAESAGLREVEVLFYHYHAVPPMVEAEIPALARRASLEMENPLDWRGHIQASAFILRGVRG